MTQYMRGHVCFENYLCKIGKLESENRFKVHSMDERKRGIGLRILVETFMERIKKWMLCKDEKESKEVMK